MKYIISLLLIFSINDSYACSMIVGNITNPKPPRFLKGKWIKPVISKSKRALDDYKKLIKTYSIIFSAQVEEGLNENNLISKYIYTDEIWKGNMLKNYELNTINSTIKLNDGACGTRIHHGSKYIFFAELGTRKNPIKILKIEKDSPEIRKYLKEPIKRWINGRIVN